MRYGTWLGNGKSGGSYTGEPFRVVLHTTETTGLPTYSSGASAPHFTYQPVNRTFYQHTDTDTASRALRNLAGGVQTNRAGAIQLEVICYSAKSIADQSALRIWVGDLTDHHLYDIRKFLEWCFTNFGVQDTWPERQALSYAQANAPGFRMSFADWNVFDGVCGHQHVPENTHWDPGALDWSALITESDMRLPPEREADLHYLVQRGAISGAVNPYYYPNPPNSGAESNDLPDAEWVNLAIAAAAGVGKTEQGGAAHNHDGRYLRDVEGLK